MIYGGKQRENEVPGEKKMAANKWKEGERDEWGAS